MLRFNDRKVDAPDLEGGEDSSMSATSARRGSSKDLRRFGIRMKLLFSERKSLLKLSLVVIFLCVLIAALYYVMNMETQPQVTVRVEPPSTLLSDWEDQGSRFLLPKPLAQVDATAFVKKRIVMVTVDAKGLFGTSSGIATMMLNYAQLYKEMGHDVATLAAVYSNAQFLKVQAQFKQMGIDLYKLDPKPDVWGDYWMMVSYSVYQWLKAREDTIDMVVFHDWRGIALYSAYAKKTGLAFDSTLLVTTCHTSSRLSDFYNARVLDVSSMVLYGLEDMSRIYSDVTIFPSVFFRDYVRDNYVGPPVTGFLNPAIIPNFSNLAVKALDGDKAAIEVGQVLPYKKFAMFGRMDRLKGLFVFIRALIQMIAAGIFPEAVAFIGSISTDNKNFVEDKAANWPKSITVEFRDDMHTAKAIEYMKENQYIAVTPSLGDNFPMVAVECLLGGVPLIHSDAGALPDISQNTFNMVPAGDVKKLEIALRNALADGVKLDALRVENSAAKESYKALMNLLPASRAVVEGFGKMQSRSQRALQSCKDVTVAMAHHDRPGMLVQALTEFAFQSCKDFSILLYDTGACGGKGIDEVCGSPDVLKVVESLRLVGIQVDMLRAPYNDYFIAEARNDLLKLTKTPFIILFDDDDIPALDMVRSMRAVVELNPAVDVVTGFAANFAGEWVSSVKEKPKIKHISLAAGPVGAGSFFINYVGKATMLLRVSKALEVGGTIPEFLVGNSPFVDWGLYQRLLVSGAKELVIPEVIYFYRENSPLGSVYNSRDPNKFYYAHRKLVQDYCRQQKLSNMDCDILTAAKLNMAFPALK